MNNSEPRIPIITQNCRLCLQLAGLLKLGQFSHVLSCSYCPSSSCIRTVICHGNMLCSQVIYCWRRIGGGIIHGEKMNGIIIIWHDRQRLCNYPLTPTDYGYTDNHLRLGMVVVALCISMCTIECWLNLWMGGNFFNIRPHRQLTTLWGECILKKSMHAPSDQHPILLPLAITSHFVAKSNFL